MGDAVVPQRPSPGVVGGVSGSAAEVAALRAEAAAYLQSLLNKILVVHTGDGRLFRGEFKCTDPDRNLVLAHATEYRPPTARERSQQAAQQAAGADGGGGGGGGKVVMDMASRYLGLIVVPGEHIARIELEEFASQRKRPEPAS